MSAAQAAPPVLMMGDGPEGLPVRFAGVRRLIRADTEGEVAEALDALDAALAEGSWIAGFASYELGYALEPRLAHLMPKDRRVPLLIFGVCDPPRPAEGPAAAGGEATLAPPRPRWDRQAHGRATRAVLDYIAAGDIYQANLTMRLASRWSGDPLALYDALARRQAVGHAALVALPDCPVIVSRSPELFFRTDAGGRIVTRPMKGTAPRHPDPAEDARLREALQRSVKDRAENLMIVDLLRNDISRIAQVGSVRVPSLYAIETYATVHQMVSEVTGELLPGTGLSALLGALFPCGSVTGAPKIRAMEIIRELEEGPRGVYCGAVGWMAPDGRSSFNVAIRTVTLYPGGEAEIGVGGGIVIDSTPDGEYEEALWKARFAMT